MKEKKIHERINWSPLKQFYKFHAFTVSGMTRELPVFISVKNLTPENEYVPTFPPPPFFFISLLYIEIESHCLGI